MKIKKKRKRNNTTVIKSLSMHYIKEKAIVSVAYKHTEHIKTTNPKGRTNSLKDVTNFTLLDKVRVPRLIPELGNAARSVVGRMSFLDAADISKYYQLIDWRQAAALKAWRTRRGHGRPVIQVI